ncbi:MAG: phosphate uptake regulator [Natronomonas sp.]|jgi:phosphate uptake regulator
METDNERIERKVQLTGGSTYTVSLPKKWAQTYNIEPGETVTLYTRGEQLVLFRAPDQKGNVRDRIEIDTSQHDTATIRRQIEAAYTSGTDEIHLTGLADTTDRRAATEAMREFIGLEVMGEGEHSLTARTMLDAADLSAHRTLQQIQRTTLEMHEDAIRAVLDNDAGLGERIATQDETVDRLFALISREFQRSLVDPNIPLQRDHLSAFEYYMAARQLERIADHAEKIAITAGALEEPPATEVAESLEAYGTSAREIVREGIDGLFDDSISLSAVIGDAEELLTELSSFDEALHQSAEDYRLSVVLDSIVRTVQYGVNVAEAGLRAGYREVEH